MSDKSDVIEIEPEVIAPVVNSPKAVMATAGQLRRQMKRDEEVRAVINEYIKNNMVEGKDYGTITVKDRKGIEHTSKPSLFKPGGEKFCSLFKIRPAFKKDIETVEMLGNTPGIIAYICELVDTSGNVIGEGRGTAKADPNGADFDINKQVKIAQKRAQIDAVLRAGGLSDFFTQDMEDAPRIGAQSNETDKPYPATIKQKNLISKLFLERGAKTPNLLLASIKANGINPQEMSAKQASELIEKLFAYQAGVVTDLDANDVEHLEEIVGRGDGDPDVHGYPGDTVVDDMGDEEIEDSLAEAEAALINSDANPDYARAHDLADDDIGDK